MNEGIHLDLDTWIVPGQIRKANLCRGLGNRYTPAGTEVLISATLVHTANCPNTLTPLRQAPKHIMERAPRQVLRWHTYPRPSARPQSSPA